MNITFGIITDGKNPDMLHRVLHSIEQQEIWEERFEIIVVGGNEAYKDDLIEYVPFDETQKKAWITRKKNIIIEKAKKDNICFLHDYVALEPDWFRNFEEINGGFFHVAMTPIINADGTRYRDWTLWPHDLDNIWGPHCRECLLPYDVDDLTHWQYISGAYWVAKTWVMKKYPLNESLSWGESEDVEWSKRVRKEFKFTMNKWSPVRLLKQKDRVFAEITPETLKLIRHAKWNSSI
jgi:glycosyltransferase involved in cell wall biosynthesis